jgi:DNA helicase-2/ATP-dependent DNA helicase PcrA
MTRAKDHLDIIVPQRFYTHRQTKNGDQHVYAARTRFMPASMLPLFEPRAWPTVAIAPAAKPSRTGERADLAARMRGMWR